MFGGGTTTVKKASSDGGCGSGVGVGCILRTRDFATRPNTLGPGPSNQALITWSRLPGAF
jgi:hypothetical protein